MREKAITTKMLPANTTTKFRQRSVNEHGKQLNVGPMSGSKTDSSSDSQSRYLISGKYRMGANASAANNAQLAGSFELAQNSSGGSNALN